MIRVDIAYLIKTISLTILLASLSHAAKPKKCDRPWRTFHDVCFFFADNNQQKFEDAQSICYKMGGFLASIRSSQEQGFIIKTVQGMGSSYQRVRWLIGLHQYDPADNKAYRWLDGSVSGFRNWMPTQPNSVYERCTLLDGSNGYKWRDEICSNRALFICRKDLEENGSMNCFKGQPPSNQIFEKPGISVTECLEHCRGLGFSLAGTIPDKCFCLAPDNVNKNDIVDRVECNGNCQNQHCGNNNFVTIYNLTFYTDTAESCEDLSQVGLSHPSTYVTKSGEEEKVQNCFSDDQSNENELELQSTHASRVLSTEMSTTTQYTAVAATIGQTVIFPTEMSTTTQSTAVEATIGQTVIFPCNIKDSGVLNILWKHEKNRTLFNGNLRITSDERIQINGSSLHLTSVQPTHSGEYSCQIDTNSPYEQSYFLNVLYPPTVHVHPKGAFIVAKEGGNVTLSCDATGYPTPIIIWTFSGIHFNSMEGNKFFINNAQIQDSGEYECIASNSIGEPASAILTVKVVSAPKVYIVPRDGQLVVQEGEAISLECEAEGEPNVDIIWKKPNGERMLKTNDQSKILIPEASRKDDGIYECFANNSFGMSSSAEITVQVLFSPNVHMSDSRIHAKEGDNISIICVSEGKPLPNVTWVKNESQVLPSTDRNDLRLLGFYNILNIYEIQEEDFGKYECTATNVLGNDTGTTHLLGQPQVPIFRSKPQRIQPRTYMITWKVSDDTLVDEFCIMYREKGHKGDWKKITARNSEFTYEDSYIQTYWLGPLQSATEYEVAVMAKNKFGWSDQSEVLAFVTEQEVERITDAPANLNGVFVYVNFWYSLWVEKLFYDE